eukprot:4550008-Pyramimonas_sp.AAC.1
MDAGGSGGGNMRLLRTWGPEQQVRVRFQRWVREVVIWSVATSDLNGFRQAAYVSSRPIGMARGCVDEWPSAVLTQGGHFNGNPAPPMTFPTQSQAE